MKPNGSVPTCAAAPHALLQSMSVIACGCQRIAAAPAWVLCFLPMASQRAVAVSCMPQFATGCCMWHAASWQEGVVALMSVDHGASA